MKKIYKKQIEKAKFTAKAFIWLNKNKKFFPWKFYKLAKMFPRYIYFLHCKHKEGKIYYKKLRKSISERLNGGLVNFAKWINECEKWMKELF